MLMLYSTLKMRMGFVHVVSQVTALQLVVLLLLLRIYCSAKSALKLDYGSSRSHFPG